MGLRKRRVSCLSQKFVLIRSLREEVGVREKLIAQERRKRKEQDARERVRRICNVVEWKGA